MFIVNFKAWHNNFSDPIETEEFENILDAFDRANSMNSVHTDYIGDNNYVTNGLEVWVENEFGIEIFRP